MKKSIISFSAVHRATQMAKQAIKKHAKSLLAAVALVAGGFMLQEQILSAEGIGLAWSIGLVARCKKQGLTLDAETESFLKELDVEVNEAFKQVKDGTLTKEGLDTLLEEKAEKIAGLLNAKNIKIGEKSIDQILRDQGTDIEKLLAGGGEGNKPKSLKDIIDEAMPAIKDIMQAKKGVHKITIKAAEIMTTDNNPDYEENEIPAQAMESMSLAAFVPKRYANEFINEVADRTVVSDIEQYTVWDEEGNIEGTFAIVEEGGLKPLLSGKLVKNFTEAKKVAGKYVFTEEFQKFRKRAFSIIQRIIRDQMLRDYNALLTTDLNAAAVPYGGTALDGTFAAPNDYDAIGAIASQMETFNFYPDVMVLHPQDKWRIRLTKDANGRYQFPVTTQDGQTRIFEFRIVTSTKQQLGWFTLAESGLFKIEEETLTIRTGYGINVTKDGEGKVTEVEHDVDHNRFRVIVETWFKDWLATVHVGAIVRGQFSTIKTALLNNQE